MHRNYPVILDVWREACRHIEISQSAAEITRRLADRLPIEQLIVRQIDLEHLCVDTVAVGGEAVRGGAGVTGRTPCSADEIAALAAWQASGRILHADDAQWRHERELLLPGPLHGDFLMGPLAAEGAGGALIVVAKPDRQFERADVDLFSALLEPFSAALANDRRLREMTALREVAEAERRALLTRLGRNKIEDVVVGVEAGLRQVMERVDIVCASDVPVLLLGETGTGKEVVARAIHQRSPRRDKPFIRVNCGAIPPELIDSQLFGHERGSFTGAVDTHRGWFERADAGTLLLDEIGELPAAAQVRLLRVFQDGYIERIGGRQSIHVDVRIVAATHRDLAAMVRQGSFREDLWYRLAAFPIPIPPLRERPEDISAMACHFAERAATRFGLPLVMPTPDDLRLLRQYSWPGNVRELRTVVDRAALLGNGKLLDVATALGTGPSIAEVAPGGGVSMPAVRIADTAGTLGFAAPVGRDVPLAGRATSLDDVARRHIEETLRETYGRIEGPHGAARRLKVNPHTLRYRMRKLGIDWRRFRQTAEPG
ncbi:MAG: sigma 54-interacting transcriptional regulator [Phycisphaerae bacterium]|nr:sigma 54-interacting transcriptional regulator [Phycisphaerae bacterium]